MQIKELPVKILKMYAKRFAFYDLTNSDDLDVRVQAYKDMENIDGYIADAFMDLYNLADEDLSDLLD